MPIGTRTVREKKGGITKPLHYIFHSEQLVRNGVSVLERLRRRNGNYES